MKIIGLTGGIGSGKSSVLEIFKKIGIRLFVILNKIWEKLMLLEISEGMSYLT